MGRLARTLRPMILSLLLLLALPPNTSAQEANPTAAHTYTFGQSLEITLTPAPGASLERARLFLRTGNGTHTEVFRLTAVEGRVRYQRDLRERPLTPFTAIHYWWEYGEETQQRTAPTTFLYEDNRFQWTTLKEGSLTVNWVDGELKALAAALDVARIAQERIADQLGLAELEPAHIYIYPSNADLQLALRLAGIEWVAGEARPEVGVVLIAIPPTAEARPALERLLPHELAHLALYQSLGPQRYPTLPPWLAEGIATASELRTDPAYAVTLERAQNQNTLLSFTELCEPFSALGHEEALLAYAQSASLVDYLRRVYGWSGIRTLVAAYGDGLACVAGPRRVLGIDPATLERSWRGWLETGELPASDVQQTLSLGRIVLYDIAPWLLLGLFVSLPVVFLLIGGRRASR